MHYYRVEGKSKKECWEKARKEYGDCISEITFEKIGHFSKKRYILGISITDEDLNAFKERQAKGMPNMTVARALEEIRNKQSVLYENKQPQETAQKLLGKVEMQDPNVMIMTKLNNLEKALRETNRSEPKLHPNIAYIKEILKENEFFDDFINEIVSAINKDISLDEVENRRTVEEFVYNYIKNKLTFTSIAKPEDRQKSISVLIGPTGIGKSTTIAKLAGNIIWQYQKNVNVHIISIDGYKIGGFAQMQTYAEFLHTQFDSVVKNEDFQKMLAMSQADYVLVDTTGRSQTDETSIIKMKELLSSKFDMKYFLAISAATKAKEVRRIFECFKHHFRDIEGIIITKLDESSSIGAIINEAINYNLSFAYVTDGQKVPTNLKKANEDVIMSLINGIRSPEPCEIVGEF